MNNETTKIRLYKEKEKLQQVTHWDLDYLSKDEIRNLCEQEQGQLPQKNKKDHVTGSSVISFSNEVKHNTPCFTF